MSAAIDRQVSKKIEYSRSMKTKLTFLLALTFLFLFSDSSVVVANDLKDVLGTYDRKDYKTAHKFLLPCAEQGDAKAQNNLGIMYDQGKGVPQGFKKAVKCWKLPTEQFAKITKNQALMAMCLF